MRDVTLHDIYDLDMGRRSEDMPTWARMIEWAFDERAGMLGGLRVAEVGIGDGRIIRGLRNDPLRHVAVWYGFDCDEAFLRRAVRVSPIVRPVLGDASLPATWREMTGLDLVIIPYSTLFLFEHDQQEAVMQLAQRSLRAGGMLAIEVFVPRVLESGTVTQVNACRNPHETEETWARRTIYDVDAAARRTVATRLYGPCDVIDGVRAEMRVVETIYWRAPVEFNELCVRAGFGRASIHFARPGHVASTVPVAADHALIVARV